MRSLFLGILALAIALISTAPARAGEAGDLLVRLRGIGFMTDTHGSTDALGGSASTTPTSSQ